MKIALETLGCKLNQAETEKLGRQFTDNGHTLVDRNDSPDIYILNTCTVTGTADSKSRHLARMVKRRNPLTKVVLTGCYAERAPEELSNMDGIDAIVGNDGKTTLVARLKSSGLLQPEDSSKLSSSAKKHTRAFVKIQDGCRNFCSYCIVPYVRSKEYSIKADELIEEIKQRSREGCKEIVLTGTRIGGYGADGLTLKELVKRILQETDIPRIRLSSLQPREISHGLLELWQDKRLCPHFHLSLQSGSAAVLNRMHRLYTPDDFERTIALIRKMIQDVSVTTDVIVGFPGETDSEFEESYAFCRKIGFARIHVFPYSPREGTEAAAMAGQVPDKVKKERTSKMLALAAESALKFREQFKGETLDVLWEQETDKGVWSGVTGNYLRVYRKSENDLGNIVDSTKIS
jgi:threonylcarbamoyladenosine tRNA methylthiotransferase MtaB